MISKKKLLKNSRLYVILDSDILKEGKILKTAREVISGGADIIQLRGRRTSVSELIRIARKLKKISGKKPLIINDRLEVALAIGADGLHVGQGDISLSAAKKILGAGKIIGVSAKNMAQARTAKKAGADYLGIGPVFKTPIKIEQEPRGFALLKKAWKLNIPAFAIGGINYSNVMELTIQGFKKIAVIRAVSSQRDPRGAAKKLKEALY